jgi:PRTRC genetic system protein E
MKTNFFELVAGLSLSGNLQINIHQHDSGSQTVSVLLSAKDPKATAGKTLPPMLLKGSPQELDNGFFQYISEPAKQTEKLFANADAYKKELDKAQKLATTAKETKTTTVAGATAKAPAKGDLFSASPEPLVDDNDDDDDEPLDEQPDDSEALAEKQRLYDEAMQRVNTLNGQMKYAEAIAQLPDPEEYPDKVEEIRIKGEALLKRQEMYASLQQDV